MNITLTSNRRPSLVASTFLGPLVLFSVLARFSATAQEVIPQLVYPVSEPQALTPAESGLVRPGGRCLQVRVNWDLLSSLDGSRPTTVSIPLGSDLEIHIVLEARRQLSRSHYVWKGRADHDSYSEFNLSVAGDEARFLFVDPATHTTLAMRPTEGGVHMIFDPTTPDCSTCADALKQEAAPPLGIVSAASFTVTKSCPTDCSTLFSSLPNKGRVDILFYYTSQAKDAAGNKTKLINDIQSALNIANSAHSDSGTGAKLRYVGALALPAEMGTEATLGDIDTIRDQLVFNNTNTTSSSVYTDRGFRGADLVCVVTTLKTAGGIDGQASLPTADDINNNNPSETQFTSGIKWDNLERILHHELGHNFGCGHDSAHGDGLFDCSHGFVEDHIFNTLADCVAHCQTVMAYGTKPFGTKDFNDRIGRFSDPNAQVTLSDNCLGLYSHTFTIGSATQNNVRTICNTKRLLASYRQGVYFADNNLSQSDEDGTAEDPFLGLGTAIDAADNGDIIRIKAGNYVPRTISKARTLTAYGGNVIIGQ